MDTEQIGSTTFFVAHEEIKESVGSKKVLKVFLIDTAGSKHLAATGEDLGDAHYHYRSTKPLAKKYGNLDCHNRKELITWLEMVISESGGHRDGAHLGADEQNPEGVYFTTHRYERAHYPDGRRCNRWYLVDQHGEEHLAVIGIERDTKDGHYNYSAEEPFCGLAPLHCSNQAGVYKWLEKMLTHHTGNGGAPTLSAALSGGAAGSGASGAALSGDPAGRKRPLVINLSSIRNARMSAAAKASLEQAVLLEGTVRAKPKPKPASASAAAAAASATTKQKAVGIVQQMQIKKARKLQEDVRAEEEKLQTNHLARLRRAAAAEVNGDTAAKATTLGWLHGSLNDDELEHLDHWLVLLTTVLDLQQQAGQDQQAGQQQQQQEGQSSQGGAGAAGEQRASGSAAGAPAAGGLGETDVLVWVQQPANRRHHLRVVLECLKELGAADLPARVLVTRKVIPLVQRCLAHPHRAVASMARHMLDRWSWQLAGHMHVLGCPTYMEDHLAALEDEIAYGLVPLPQLPKHKQALLNTPIPKLPLPGGYQTPAPAKQSILASLQQQQQQAPASAPAAPNAAAMAAADGSYAQYPGQAGYGAAAAALGFNGAGFAGMAGVNPAAAQTPGGYYTPVGAAAGGYDASKGLQTKGSTGGIRGTGARGLAGLAAAAAAGGAPAGQLVYTHTAAAVAGQGAAAAAGRPPAMPVGGVGGAAAAGAGVAGQQGANYVNSAGYAGWPAAAGMYGAAGGDGALGAVAGSSTDLAAMAAAADGSAGGAGGLDAAQQAQQAAQQQQQQQLLYAMQQNQQAQQAQQQQQQFQQQLRMGMINAGMMGMGQQHQAAAGGVQYMQQPAGQTAAAAAINQWQQQQLYNWQQQQQHMQAVWSGQQAAGYAAVGGTASAAQMPQGQLQQQQQPGSQGYGQQQ